MDSLCPEMATGWCLASRPFARRHSRPKPLTTPSRRGGAAPPDPVRSCGHGRHSVLRSTTPHQDPAEVTREELDTRPLGLLCRSALVAEVLDVFHWRPVSEREVSAHPIAILVPVPHETGILDGVTVGDRKSVLGHETAEEPPGNRTAAPLPPIRCSRSRTRRLDSVTVASSPKLSSAQPMER